VVLWRERPKDEGVAKRYERDFLSLCEDFQELEDLACAAVPSALPDQPVPKDRFSFDQAGFLAARIWEQFELGAVPAEGLHRVMEETHHVRIFALPLGNGPSAASARSRRFGPAVLLNQDSVSWRRNFDLAHELFHLLTWSTFRSPGEPSSVEAPEEEESWANCFASRLLLPEGLFGSRLAPFLDKNGDLQITVGEIHDLARGFDVSAEAVVYRCAGMFRWPKEQTQRVKAQVHSCHIWRESRPAERLPSRYVSLVIQSFRRGLISYRKGAEYLRMSYKQAQDILESAGDAPDPDSPITLADR
jgi:Zn-dependent peptidase ImmA (M78 family)